MNWLIELIKRLTEWASDATFSLRNVIEELIECRKT